MKKHCTKNSRTTRKSGNHRNNQLVYDSLEPRQLLAALYVDNTGGSDSNNGTSLGSAFETIQRAANLAQAGDTVYIREGIYRETVTVPRSGTSAAPIRFESWADEDVVISGGDKIVSWTAANIDANGDGFADANIWQATVNWNANNSRDANTLFVDGELKYEAQLFAENDLLDANDWGQIRGSGDLVTLGTTLTSTDLRGFGDDYWNGAKIYYQALDYTYESRTIVDYNSSAGRVTFDSPAGSVSHKQVNLFYIYDSIKALDKAGEWYKNGNTLYYKAESGQNPNGLDIEFKRRAYGFDLRGRQRIEIDDITFRGVSINTDANSDFHVYSNNLFYAHDRAQFGRFNVNGNDVVIRDNEFSHVWHSALNMSSSSIRNSVINNYFHDIGLVPTARVLNVTQASEFFFSHNTVSKFARSVSDGYPVRSEFSYNIFENAGRTSYDSGVFDSDGTNGNSSYSIFHHNVFRNTNSRGITETFYGGNSNAVIYRNIIYNWVNASGRTVFASGGTDFRQAYHNTIIGSAPVGRAGSVEAEAIIQTRYNNNLQLSVVGMEALGVDTRGNYNYSSSDFVNMSAGDLRLKSGSGAIDIGILLPGINDVYSGAAPDAGALEFGQAMWAVGHDFINKPNPVYAWTSLPGTNLYTNSLFGGGIGDWTIVAGTPNSQDRNSWNLGDSSLTGFFRTQSVEFTPGEALQKTFTGLKPNTAYTVGAAARIIDEVTIGDQYQNSSGSGLTTGINRDTPFVAGLTANSNSWVEYQGIDFGSAGLYDQIEILAARKEKLSSIAGTSIEIRLDSPTGTLLGRMDDLIEFVNETKFRANRSELTPVTGGHSIFVSVKGSNAANVAVGSVRLLQSDLPASDLLTMSVQSPGAISDARGIGWTDWQSGYEVITFTTGPTATSATIKFENDGRINAYLDRLYLVEGEVRTGDNLAYVTGNTSQSTTASGAAAANAVDQNNATVSETQDISNSWWQVRFGADFSIGDIELVNRDDSRFYELSNFTLSVWNEDPDNGGSKLWEKDYYSSGSVSQGGSLVIHGGTIGNDGVTRLGSAFGRVVRVQLNGLNNADNGRLSLADVKVRDSSNARPVANVAQYGEASQSADFYADIGKASLANNGKVDPVSDFTSAANEPGAWWQVELQQTSPVDQIVVVNRQDAANRIGNFRVSVWNGDPDAGGSEIWGKNYSYSSSAGAVSTSAIGPGGALRIDGNTQGSNGVRLNTILDAGLVRVQLLGSNILSLAEVQVWSNRAVTVDTNQTEFFYDLGASDSVLFTGSSDPYVRLPHFWEGDIEFVGGNPQSFDRGSAAGVNGINRDGVQVTGGSTFNHRLSDGIWKVLLNIGDRNFARDDIRVAAEGQTFFADVDRAAGVFNPNLIFEVRILDGQLNLTLDDLGGVNGDISVTRINLERVADLPVASVDNRYVFYNNSYHDGSDVEANAADDTALATDKFPLLPGQTATFANYTSYDKGVNGIFIDVENLRYGAAVTAADFLLATGNSSNFTTLATELGVNVRTGAGVGGSDRVTLTLADESVTGQWLRVTLLANGITGLDQNDVFYFGNAIGDTGNSDSNSQVTSVDEIGARNHPRNFTNRAGAANIYDFNRDSLVTSQDEILARNNNTNFNTDLNLITAMGPPAQATSSSLKAGDFLIIEITEGQPLVSAITSSVTKGKELVFRNSVQAIQRFSSRHRLNNDNSKLLELSSQPNLKPTQSDNHFAKPIDDAQPERVTEARVPLGDLSKHDAIFASDDLFNELTSLVDLLLADVELGTGV